MSSYLIRGGAPLFGSVRVQGSKNSALPIILSTIVTRGVSKIHNLPDITDVHLALDILRTLGATVDFSEDTTLINTEGLQERHIPDHLISGIRASTYLLGSLSARFSHARILNYGGCGFAHRPIDLHLSALSAFGAVIDGADITLREPHAAELSFPIPSVGATVNSLILAASIEGVSRIRGIAREPHILDLADFLRSSGAHIEIDGDTATVRGGGLSGGEVYIRGDMIEAGTYLTAGILTGGSARVNGVDPSDLDSFIAPLKESGVAFSLSERSVSACGRPQRRISITAAPYPAFPTDLQPILAPLLSICGGDIRDRVWQSRFGYLDMLSRYGISYRHIDGGAEIFPSEVHSADSISPDLRGGMALILASLMADGESVVGKGEYIERGYAHTHEKFSRLGAEITRLD